MFHVIYHACETLKGLKMSVKADFDTLRNLFIVHEAAKLNYERSQKLAEGHEDTINALNGQELTCESAFKYVRAVNRASVNFTKASREKSIMLNVKDRIDDILS